MPHGWKNVVRPLRPRFARHLRMRQFFLILSAICPQYRGAARHSQGAFRNTRGTQCSAFLPSLGDPGGPFSTVNLLDRRSYLLVVGRQR
jgi:hypothetical protein